MDEFLEGAIVGSIFGRGCACVDESNDSVINGTPCHASRYIPFAGKKWCNVTKDQYGGCTITISSKKDRKAIESVDCRSAEEVQSAVGILSAVHGFKGKARIVVQG